MGHMIGDRTEKMVSGQIVKGLENYAYECWCCSIGNVKFLKNFIQENDMMSFIVKNSISCGRLKGDETEDIESN